MSVAIIKQHSFYNKPHPVKIHCINNEIKNNAVKGHTYNNTIYNLKPCCHHTFSNKVGFETI